MAIAPSDPSGATLDQNEIVKKSGEKCHRIDLNYTVSIIVAYAKFNRLVVNMIEGVLISMVCVLNISSSFSMKADIVEASDRLGF